ncbi:MAG: hypothetical protein ACOC4B_02480 [Bacteroidota bacterium]
MTTAKDFNTKSNTEVETSFDSLPLETLKHGFIRKNNFYIRRGVPESHRRIADNFMIIKKIFGHPVVQSSINEEEKLLLARYDFNQLEYTTEKQIEDEIVFLKKWSYSNNKELQEASDEIIKIRAKELKYLIASNYVSITNRVYNGHKILEKYFEDISKYFSDSF